MGIFNEFKEILQGFVRVSRMLHKNEKVSLILATIIMLITGFLTNLPAVILGRFVDRVIGLEKPTFGIAVPFLIWIVIIILTKEALTVIRKYLVENVATHTEKKQTVAIIGRLLRTDIGQFINKYQIKISNNFFFPFIIFIRIFKHVFIIFDM